MSFKKDDVKVLERKTCYNGFFRIEEYTLKHRLYRGGWSDTIVRESFHRGDAAAVLPYDPVRNEVVLIEQFRIGALSDRFSPWLVEIVAGVLDSGESPENVAKREAVEEAGCILTELIKICDYYVSPGGTSELITLFCGKVDSSDVGGFFGLCEEGEDIKAQAVGLNEALNLVQSGVINSASPIMALQWLALNKKMVHESWS